MLSVILLISKNSLLHKKLHDLFVKEEKLMLIIMDNINEAAKTWVANYPILTIVDIDIPTINPYEFIKDISKDVDTLYSPHPFLFLSNTDPESIQATKRALERVRSGDLIIKDIQQGTNDSLEEVITTIMNIYKIYLNKNITTYKEEQDYSREKHDLKIDASLYHNTQSIIKNIKHKNIKLIVIGISTGGPLILKRLFSLINHISYPIIIVQHTIPDFLDGYTKALSHLFNFPICIAKQGETIINSIYFAPDKAHLKLSYIDDKITILLEHSKPIKGYIPSIEVIFGSVLKEEIPALGIIMTGLGDDGVNNLKLLHSKGYITIAQSPENSAASGMPLALIKQNGADAILTVEEIAEVLNSI